MVSGGGKDELSMMSGRNDAVGTCQCLKHIASGGLDGGERAGRGHRDSGGKPGERVGNAFSPSGPDPDAVAAVVVQGGTGVPAVNSVGCPGAANGRLLVDKSTGAWWR